MIKTRAAADLSTPPLHTCVPRRWSLRREGCRFIFPPCHDDTPAITYLRAFESLNQLKATAWTVE